MQGRSEATRIRNSEDQSYGAVPRDIDQKQADMVVTDMHVLVHMP